MFDLKCFEINKRRHVRKASLITVLAVAAFVFGCSDQITVPQDLQIFGETAPTQTQPPSMNSLGQNYPNPFNPTTTIMYSIKERAHVTLKIYSETGQLVKTLVDEEQSPAPEGFAVRWNGQNDGGSPVCSGSYFYVLTVGDWQDQKKMLLLK